VGTSLRSYKPPEGGNSNFSRLGLEKMSKSMTGYVKSVSKRSEIEGKEKTLPIASLGGTMISHGEDFDPDSEYGQCLTSESSFNGISIWLLTFAKYLAGRKRGWLVHKRHTYQLLQHPGLSVWRDLSFR
jgi:hypothetical protein